MARANYGLESIREGTVKSSNGTTYTVNILYTGTGASTAMVIGESGIKIAYDSPEDKTKNSYIITSQCTIGFMVQDATDKNFITSLSTTYQEKDVWITVREGSNVLWCGYLILDLSDEQDVSYPYETTLTAIDGLAALKQVPFIRETNLSSGAVPTFPYVADDTFYSSSFNQLIGTGTTHIWLSELIYKTGMVLAADDQGGTTFLENYKIQTAVNYYNEDHPSPAADKDPLAYTRIKLHNLHSINSQGYVSAPDAYTVLENICKNFGMRCIYWQHNFHFIQINEYNTDEDAAGTAASPINIPTRVYLYTGVADANQNYLGNNNLSIYDLNIENGTAPAEGIQKLAGTVYTGLPALKTVKGVYLASASQNAYIGFPLLPGTWDTSGNEITYTRYTKDAAGNNLKMNVSKASGGTGFKVRINLSFENTSSTDLRIRMLFTIRAKEVGTGWAAGKVLKRNTTSGSYEWVTMDAGSVPLFTGTSAIGKYAKSQVWIPPSPVIDQSVGIMVYDSANDPYANQYGLIPKDTAFTGDWEFQFVAFIMYDSNAANPMQGHTSFGGSANHGSCTTYATTGATNYDGTAVSTFQDVSDYAYDYNNTLNPNNNTLRPFSGTFRLEGVTEGVPTIYEVDVVNNNSFEVDNGNYFWGDGFTVQVSSDGSSWDFADADGKWQRPTYVWNNGTSVFDYTTGAYDNTLVELVLKDMIYNQPIHLKQFNGTTALSKTNKYYSGTTILKYMNPIGKLIDADNKQYTLMRGTFNLVMDEWDVTLNEVYYEVPSETINVGTRTYDGEIQMETG